MPKTFAHKKFCTWCSDKLKKVNDNQSICQGCKISEFNNPKAAAAAVILNEKGEILCGVRAHEPSIGKLDLPGGFVDVKESVEEAIIRELKEELGLTVKQSEVVPLFTYYNFYTFEGVTQNIVDIVFKLEIPSDTVLKPADDVASVKWIRPEDLDYENFWSPYMAKRLKQYFAN